jgi:multimeric flavodoxin WrbA
MIFAERFLRADLVVMAAPTFFKNIPGPAKNFLDRFSGTAFDSDLKPRFSHDTGYLLMTSCGAPAIADHLSGQSAGAIRSMRSFFDMSGMRYRGSLVLTDANKIKEPPVSFRRKMLRLARRL